MGLLLRPATPSDELFLYQLAYEHFAEILMASLWDPNVREPLLKLQVEGQRTAYASQHPTADYAIIMYDDHAIGRIILDRGPQFHYLVDITIQKKYRGSGIGTWLMRALCVEAEMMRKPLRLHVMVTNRARNLYQRLGFHAIETSDTNWLMERAPGASSQVSLVQP